MQALLENAMPGMRISPGPPNDINVDLVDFEAINKMIAEVEPAMLISPAPPLAGPSEGGDGALEELVDQEELALEDLQEDVPDDEADVATEDGGQDGEAIDEAEDEVDDG